jgi:hypothetical protein
MGILIFLGLLVAVIVALGIIDWILWEIFPNWGEDSLLIVTILAITSLLYYIVR